jgi:hypothetical protein
MQVEVKRVQHPPLHATNCGASLLWTLVCPPVWTGCALEHSHAPERLSPPQGLVHETQPGAYIDRLTDGCDRISWTN